MKQVVVVVPIYKEELKLSEKAALRQLYNVLGHYDICFIAPERMKKFLRNKGVKAEFWDDDTFDNVDEYSRLLLTVEFYNRFTDYEYMLIYQLDAFIFSDKLKEFCDRGYDYIGAPVPHWVSLWRNIKNRVGNGGFSLRKIESCIRLLKRKKEIISLYAGNENFEMVEDQFFAFAGSHREFNFNAAKSEEALSFAIDLDYGKGLKKLSQGYIPFGCHGWSKPRSWRLWEPYIKDFIPNWVAIVSEEFGKLKYESYVEVRRNTLIRYLFERLCRGSENRIYSEIAEKTIPLSFKYVLWGGGKIGRSALTYLKSVKREVGFVIDTNPDIKEFEGLNVLLPEEALRYFDEYKIIVSVTKPKYVEEITAYLNGLGLQQNKDYILYNDMIERLAMSYWEKSVIKWGS